MNSTPRILAIAALHALTCCGPRATAPLVSDLPPKGNTTTEGAGSASSSLPQGKKPSSIVTGPPGVLVTRVDADQLDIVYASAGPFSPGERLRKAMEASEAAFRFEALGTSPSNFHELFDGMREPDPFLVVATDGDAQVGKLYDADPAILADALDLIEKMEASPQDQGKLCGEWEALIERDPHMPMLHEQLAGCYQAAGDIPAAVAALQKEIEINPTHAGAQLGVAAALAGPDTQTETRRHVLLSLLYYPAFSQARKWVNTTGALASTTARTEYFAPQLSISVDEAGWVVVRSPENQPWVGEYATCKAGFRYAPEVRMAFGMKAGSYKPSLLEEMVCLRLAGDAYRAGVDEGRTQEVMGEIFVRAIDEQRLLEASFFEVIGYHDPDMMKLLPAELRELIASWIEDTVLIEKNG